MEAFGVEDTTSNWACLNEVRTQNSEVNPPLTPPNPPPPLPGGEPGGEVGDLSNSPKTRSP
ncbi:MAG: hypothetical protein F6K24_15245 [Okeania sp. SIO2D1]|nr:hypothetical protein [Okeania sp. SIO2D1]